MSRYEWEQGEFTIPTAEWSRVKKEIRRMINNDIMHCFALAIEVHKQMTENYPKLRGHEAYDLAFECLHKSTFQRLSDAKSSYIMNRLFPDGCHNKQAISRPTKKAFSTYSSTIEYISDSECSIEFTNENRKIEYYVQENNHACERAREGIVGRALFTTLGTVKWTRGSGGNVWGNDEYNRDSGREYSGGGGSYQKESFGPKNEKAVKVTVNVTPSSRLRFR